MNNYNRQRMSAARSLLRLGNYEEAHKILVATDDPAAKRLLERIIKKYPALRNKKYPVLQKTVWQQIRMPVLVSLLVGLLILVVVLTVDSNQKRGNFEIRQSQIALEEYCHTVMDGNAPDCVDWSRQQLEYDRDRAHVKVCRLRHDVYANPGAFGICLNSN